MKRILEFILAATLACVLMALTGCASDEPPTTTTTTTTDETTVQPAH